MMVLSVIEYIKQEEQRANSSVKIEGGGGKEFRNFDVVLKVLLPCWSYRLCHDKLHTGISIR